MYTAAPHRVSGSVYLEESAMRQLSAVLAVCVSIPVAAQQPAPAVVAPTASLGQPSAWTWTGAAATGWSDQLFATTAFGLQRPLLNPLLAVAAVHGEVYVHGEGGQLEPGVRARVMSPFARVGMGLDYRPEPGLDLLLSVFHPLRRGGLFHDGSVIRMDYLPGRQQTVALGIDKPLKSQTPIGRSRPRHDRVRLPAAPTVTRRPALPAAAAAALGEARQRSHRVRLQTLPLGPLPARPAVSGAAAMAAELEALLRPRPELDGASVTAVAHPEVEVRRYHAAVERAFLAALVGGPDATPAATGDPGGGDGAAATPAAGADGAMGAAPGAAEPVATALAAGARRILLTDVLLPYNRLLGQRKDADTVEGLGRQAAASFALWLERDGTVPAEQRSAVQRVFDDLLDIVEDNRAAARAQWHDSQLVWLPLQFALLPEQHDTQAELDALIEEATGTRFTEGNRVEYLITEQFQYHLSRTVRSAQDYHVLWTHDFRGLNTQGAIDEMTFRHVVGSYLAALTARVREYDTTGRLPTYIIVIDQWFYEVNRGRLWLTLLEDPLRRTVSLPPEHAAWQVSLDSALLELRTSVAESALLQERSRFHGSAWLRNLVKVHVNVTNPSDPSFWSRNVVRGIPLPDNMMRDHRKIVFYDLTEEDPYRGEAIFTGAGIGEHYANLSWEDRSLLVSGPALLPLKAAARELLTNQGIPRGRVPEVLLARPMAADYDARIEAAALRSQHSLRALQLHNGAGFSDKQINVAKAVLYTLMPPGSVLKIPDSLWNSELWASALLGCALRGGRVLVIGPAAGNAPADVFGALGRSRETLAHLLTAQLLLQDRIRSAGGLLRVGLYRTQLPVNDIPAKVRLAHRALEGEPWLRELFGFDSAVIDRLGEMAQALDGLDMEPVTFREFTFDDRPKLHLKGNFFASAEAWTLMQRREWPDEAQAYMLVRVNQLQSRSTAVSTFDGLHQAIADVGGGMVREWRDGLDEEVSDRVVFYTLMGSHNQNNRSIVIDAEVGFLMSGWPAIIPQIDLVVIIGQTTWVDGPSNLEALLPLDTGWKRRVTHWWRMAM
jgi:hypothetical protein